MSADVPAFRDLAHQRREQAQHQTPQGQHASDHEPLSPTETNPYQSPTAEKDEPDDISTDNEAVPNTHVQGLVGVPDHAPGGFGGIPRGGTIGAIEGSDRSQTSSAGASRGLAR